MSKYNDNGINLSYKDGEVPPVATPVLLWFNQRETYSLKDAVSPYNFKYSAGLGVYDAFDIMPTEDELEDIKLQMLEALFEGIPSLLTFLGFSDTQWASLIDTEVIKKQASEEVTNDPLLQKNTFGVKFILYILPQ